MFFLFFFFVREASLVALLEKKSLFSLFLRAFTAISKKSCLDLGADLISASSRIETPHASFAQYFQEVSNVVFLAQLSF